MKISLILVCCMVAANILMGKASFIDSIPFVSQLKSLIQIISGDGKEAKNTQDNFLNQTNVVPQFKSAIPVTQGDNKSAENNLLKNTEEGGIFNAPGNKERELDRIKGASSSAGSINGGLLAGPFGATLGRAATDGLITGIDSAVNRQVMPFEVGDDAVKIKYKNESDQADHFKERLDLAEAVVPRNHSSKRKGSVNKDKLDFPNLGADDWLKGGLDDELNTFVNFSLTQQLEMARKRVDLPDDYRNRLEMVDFRDVNDVNGTKNCYFCAVAAMRGMTVAEMMEQYSLSRSEVTDAITIDEIIELYKKVGLNDTELIFDGTNKNITDLYSFVYKNLEAGESGSFALAYTNLKDNVHVGLTRVWKYEDTKRVHYLITDFQQPLSHPLRFSKSLPDADIYYIIKPQIITKITESDFINMIDNNTVEFLKNGEMKNNCNGKRIIGYLPGWAKNGLSIKQAARFTNIIYAFIKLDADGRLTIPTDTLSKQRLLDAFVARKALAMKGVNLSISFAIGGWENSQYFSRVVGNDSVRSEFITNIMSVLNNYNFDGVDFDWEYPVTGGAIEGKKEDASNYVTLLREVREKVGDSKLLSIAGAAGEEALQGFDIKNIVKYVDWIGVMSYDLNGAWDNKWGAFVGPNAPLYHGAPATYSGKLNVDWAIKQYVCKSEIMNKIILGIPFYGRFWSKTVSGTDPEQYPLYRKAERVNGTFGGVKTYRELVNSWLQASSEFILNWDNQSQTPWGLHNSSKLVLTYDNPKSIVKKINYSISNNLGGVMVWSVDQDDDQLSLTTTITGACQVTGNSINYKCNPLTEKRWWTYAEDKGKAGMCGMSAPLYKGYYPRCDPDDPGYSCCSPQGYCGSGPKHCDCNGCIDYSKNPEKLIAEPVKPSRKVQWYIGFDEIKAGEPRCGPTVPPINGFQAICNPDDDNRACCSAAGYCGNGPLYCKCNGCKDFRNISEADSLKVIRSPDQIRWHVGFSEIKPGEPRCGPAVKLVNNQTAICDPDDDTGYCCSKWGYCGVGHDFCDCVDCVNSRKIKL